MTDRITLKPPHTPQADQLPYGTDAATAQPMPEGKLQNVLRTQGGYSFQYFAPHTIARAEAPKVSRLGFVSSETLLAYIRRERLYIIPVPYPGARPVALSPEKYLQLHYKRALQSYLDSGKEPVQWI